jgi:hypothetical protein
VKRLRLSAVIATEVHRPDKLQSGVFSGEGRHSGEARRLLESLTFESLELSQKGFETIVTEQILELDG